MPKIRKLTAGEVAEFEAPSLAVPLPPLPDDLGGWLWELGERGLRLVNQEEGYTTAYQSADRESACIVEARQLQQRDAALVVEQQRPDPRPPLAEVFAAMDSGAPLLVDLSLIDDNPYQPRLVYDDERIGVIAASIREHGLLQVPLGRCMANGRYQLAFGHSRLRAYRLLAEHDAERFGRMPLVIRELGDETMALHAWIENRDRKDLTAYEEAKAIERYTQAFGWNQKQAAEKLQLDRSTVANKLRLLKLPATALDQLRDGQLSERQAAALVPLMELPEALRASKRRIWLGHEIGEIFGVDDLIAKAPKLDSQRLRSAVEGVLRDLTIVLSGVPWRDIAWEVEGVQAARCADCPIRLKSSDRCPDKACAGVKESAWRVKQADAAAKAVGLPATIHRGYSDRDDLSGVNLKAIRKVAEEKTCGNLAVVFDTDRTFYPHKVEGHKDCYIVCGHGPNRRCGCKQALARRADPTTGQDAKKRHDRQRIKVELIAPAEQAIAQALTHPTAATWRGLLGRINGSVERKLPADADVDRVLAALAAALADSSVSYSLEYGYYDSARSQLATLLTALGAGVPWADVRAQTDPLTDIRERLERLERWAGGWVDATPSQEAVKMQAEDLNRLENDLITLFEQIDTATYTALSERIGVVEVRLGDWLDAAPAPQAITIRTDGGERTIEAIRLTSDLALHSAIGRDSAWTVSHRATGGAVATLRTQDAGKRAFDELIALDWSSANRGKADLSLGAAIRAVLARYEGDTVWSAASRLSAQEAAAPEPAAPPTADPLVLVREMLATAERQLADATTRELAGPVLKAVRSRLELLVDAPGVTDAAYEALIRQVLAAQERLTAPALQEATA